MRRTALSSRGLQLLPCDNFHIVIDECLSKLWTQHNVEVALPPCGPVRFVIDHDSLQLGVVAPEMHDQLR